MVPDDNILFNQVKSGNKHAFDTLFRKYYAPLCRFVLKVIKSKDLAEEIVQDIFIKIWCQREKIEITISIAAYLYKAAHNQSLNMIKKNRIRVNYETDCTEKTIKISDPIYSQKNIDEDKFRIEVTKAVKCLPQKCREIFELSRNDGLTYDEIAEYLQISKKTVENQMTIAFKKLREMLRPVIAQIYY